MPGQEPEAARKQTSGRDGALAGAVAGAAALASSELLAGLVPRVVSPVLVVGEAAVDRMPAPLRDGAIATLGPAAKPTLLVGMLTVLALGAAGLGIAATRRFAVAVAGYAALAAVGVAAAAVSGADAAASAAALSLAIALGLTLLRALLRRAGQPVPAGRSRAPDDPPAFDRRGFLRLAAGTGTLALAAALTGRMLAGRQRLNLQRAAVALPTTDRPLAPPPPDLARRVDGLAELFTPNDTFYRIDTALSVPRVDLSAWRLRVSGMVTRPLEFDYAALLAEPLVEADATLVCVSNEVGGALVGNARWLGVPLADLLARAGAHPAATQVVGRAVDGWTAGFPTDVALDGRNVLVAVGMNGEPLPPEHGFPARLVVPGLYGYVSATKWLSEIELASWDAYDAYWVVRGWSKEGPVKTQSRIDVPRNGATVPAGTVAVAGVAWAQPRGVDAVQIQIDDGAWHQARLGAALHRDTWRQWLFRWDASPGGHTLRVRAIDGEGEAQVAIASPPQPDGATGLHAIRVTVATS